MQEVGFFDEARTGELISRLHTDIGAASDMVSQNLTVMIRSTLHILVLSSFMLVTCWRLTVVSFAMVPFTECVAKASLLPSPLESTALLSVMTLVLDFFSSDLLFGMET